MTRAHDREHRPCLNRSGASAVAARATRRRPGPPRRRRAGPSSATSTAASRACRGWSAAPSSWSSSSSASSYPPRSRRRDGRGRLGRPGASTCRGAGPGTGRARPASRAPLPAGQTRTVTIQTDKGAMVLTIKADLSPIAAGNFVALASCGFYDGSPFHRVVPDFVIQGGICRDRRGGPGYTIQDEPVTAPYGRGVVAMARSSQPNSRRLAVLHRPVRQGDRMPQGVQHLPDHRQRDVRDGNGRCDRLGRRRGEPDQPGHHDQRDRRQPLTPERSPNR